MKTKLALLLWFVSISVALADDRIAGVQQSLKDQGFYYGEITGQKDTDTTAAIKRYQIRNGLEITGELNEETLRSLKVTSAAATAATSPPPAPPSAPTRAPITSPPADTSDLRAQEEVEDTSRGEPVAPPVQGQQQQPPIYNGRAVPDASDNFVGTPYQGTPPEVQRKVIADAQVSLARRGLYRGEVDGMFGPNLEFSLRAYQARVGLRPTGRLDLGTLAALELLPGANTPVFIPRRKVWREPVVRGEWVRP